MWWIYRPDAELVWKEEEVKKRLNWYYEVMVGKKVPKFVISSKLGVNVDLKKLSFKDLLKLHKEIEKIFYEVFNDYKKGKDRTIEKEDVKDVSFLDVKVETARRIMKKCILCERKCRVNRLKGRGACLVGKHPIVSSWFLHLGEESYFIPSGTIFFSGCNFKCVYCQNWDISQRLSGEKFNTYKLYLVQKELKLEGARNINWVGGDPTPNIPHILKSMKYLALDSVYLPQLWNSNFYMSKLSIKLLEHVIDVWLPDFKYGNDRCAKRLSKVENYFETITRNLKYLYCKGENIVIRHLVLPNHTKCCSKKILEWLSKNCKNVILNVMDQYRPEYLAKSYKEIDRRVSSEEFLEVVNYAKKLGLFVKS